MRYVIDLRALVAVSILGLFWLVTGMLLFKPMPMTEQAGSVLLTIVGLIIGKVGTIVDYYFGSNKDSKEKDEVSRVQAGTIATMAKVTTAAPAPPVNGKDDAAAWDEAVAMNTPAAFEAYLKAFPAGLHAAEAKARQAARANP